MAGNRHLGLRGGDGSPSCCRTTTVVFFSGILCLAVMLYLTLTQPTLRSVEARLNKEGKLAPVHVVHNWPASLERTRAAVEPISISSGHRAGVVGGENFQGGAPARGHQQGLPRHFGRRTRFTDAINASELKHIVNNTPRDSTMDDPRSKQWQRGDVSSAVAARLLRTRPSRQTFRPTPAPPTLRHTTEPIPTPAKSDPLIILPWPPSKVKFFGAEPSLDATDPLHYCPHSCRFLSKDRAESSDKRQSAAIVYDSVGFRKYDVKYYDPYTNKDSKKLVYWNLENTFGRIPAWSSAWRVRWLNQSLDENFWNMFDVVVSFESTSMVPYYYGHLFPQKEEIHKDVIARGFADKTSSRLAAFIASNCWTRRQTTVPFSREGTVKELMKYISIGSYGTCLNNLPTMDHMGCDQFKRQQKYCVISKHKFFLAFENSLTGDYVTEKLFEPLALRTIPVYLGATNIENYLPAKHSAILARDFKDMEHLAKYMQCVGSNQKLYEYYIGWRKRPLFPSWKRMLNSSTFPLCQVCGFVRGDLRSTAAKMPTPSDFVFPENMDSQKPLEECL